MAHGNIELNKIAAAVLLAGIIAMIAGIASDILYTGGIEHPKKSEAKRGYTIPGAENGAAEGAGEQAAAPQKPVDIAPFMAKADAAAGAAVAKRCTSCHTFDKGGKNGVGPNQWGLLGNHFAHKEDFQYSQAIQALKDKKIDFQTLSDFLTNPKAFAPGNKMAFAGIAKPEDRANLIAYINQQSDSPLPSPK